MTSISVDVLLKEVETLARKCSQHGQLYFIQNFLTVLYNVLRDMAGLDSIPLAPLDRFIDNDKLFENTHDKRNHLVLEVKILLTMTHSFYMRDLAKAEKMASLFADLHKIDRPVFNHIIISFYAGLVACHFGRKTRALAWKTKVEHFIKRIDMARAHSSWNFENKYLLLKAEYHHTAGESSDAEKCYNESIASAKRHKFIHEEALGYELAGYFYKEQGDEVESEKMLKHAHEAYSKWGAMKKAQSLLKMETGTDQ